MGDYYKRQEEDLKGEYEEKNREINEYYYFESMKNEKKNEENLWWG